MPKVHSHYENLKVARDAPADEIRAAYRRLTRRYHPDRNPGNAEAERIMSMVNVAYDTLSNPALHREHDRWIEQAEVPDKPLNGDRPELLRPQRRQAPLFRPPPAPPAAPPPMRRAMRNKPASDEAGERIRDQAARTREKTAARDQPAGHFATRSAVRFAEHLARFWFGYALASFTLVCGIVVAVPIFLQHGPTPLPAQVVAAAVATTGKVTAGYARSPTAPNGRSWPGHSGYLDGYVQSSKGGLSEVTIDNSFSDADLFAKLVSLDGSRVFPARVFFVAAHSRFTLTGIATGSYDLRYRNLVTGRLMRSAAFILEEVRTPHGKQKTTFTLDLNPAAAGELQSFQLGDSEF